MNPLLLLAVALAPQAEVRKVGELVSPSVVAVRNLECHGSGMILDETGLVLTNAHVAASPLAFWIEVEGGKGGKPVQFRRVTLVGVHPTKDLALLQLDPSEHAVKLVPIPRAAARAVTGDPIYALGFPSSAGGRRKVLSPGTLTGVDRFVHNHPGFLEVVSAIGPGSSGGPLCNARGEALGVVTLAAQDGVPIGWAIPLHDYRREDFGPLDRRASNPANAAGLLRSAEQVLKYSRNNGGRGADFAEGLFTRAMVEDIGNPDIYFKIGMLNRSLGRAKTASSYLVRSLRLKPWPDSRAECYRELGLSLLQQGKKEWGLTVWQEGLAKYPATGASIWDELAVHHHQEGRYLEAAVMSRAAIKAFAGRGAAMNDIYREARARLSAEDLIALRDREAGLDALLRTLESKAEEARQEGTKFMTPECGKLVEEFEDTQKEAAPSAIARPDREPTPAEYATRIVRLLIKGGKAYFAVGNTAKAIELFSEVVRDYPDHPETPEARRYLEALKE